jgi:hypothetical protein
MSCVEVQGKLDPGDAVPVSRGDAWWEMLHMLRKAF